MDWENLDKNTQNEINGINDQFKTNLLEKTVIQRVLSGISDSGTVKEAADNIIETLKKLIISKYNDSSGSIIDYYKKEAQIQFNIYFRYGCELIYSSVSFKPIVRFDDETKINLIVPPQEENISLPEYFNNFKKGMANGSINGEEQKKIFSNVMGYDFLEGKEHFLKLFKLSESANCVITTEELYSCYYIAWKNKICPITIEGDDISGKIIDIIKKGKTFLEDIIFKVPIKIPSLDGEALYEPIEYILLRKGRRKIDKKTKKIIINDGIINENNYYEILPFVFQRASLSSIGFDTIYIKDKIHYGLLDQLKYEMLKYYKTTISWYQLPPYKYKKLLLCQYEIEWKLEKIIAASTLNIKNEALKFQQQLYGCNNFDMHFNIIVCRFVERQLGENSCEGIIRTLGELRRELKPISIDTPLDDEDNGNKTIIDVLEDENTQNPELEPLVNIDSHDLYQFFKAAFTGNSNFLRKIERSLKDESKKINYALNSYLHSNEIDKNNLIKDIYENVLRAGGATVTGKKITAFHIKIRKEVLIPLAAEKIILCGAKELKKAFSEIFSFSDERKFLVYSKSIIDDSFNALKKVMCALVTLAAPTGKESNLRRKYHMKLFPDKETINMKKGIVECELPPFIDELELRKAINVFSVKKSEKKHGKFWHLRNVYLLTFNYFKDMDKTSKFLETYTNGKPIASPNTKIEFKRRIKIAIEKYSE